MSIADENTDMIKDLTDTPNKKLTAAQRRNKKTAATGGYTDINYDGVRDRDQLDFSSLDSDLQWIAAIVDADEGIRRVFEDSLKAGHFDPEAGQQGINNFQNAIRGSEWWQENNGYARSAFALKMTDPASYADSVDAARRFVEDQAKTMGITLTPMQIAAAAEKTVTDGWNTAGREYKLKDQLISFMETSVQNTKPTGNLREYSNQLRDTARANGLTLSDQYYADQAQSVLRGLTSMEDAEMDIREQAASFWPPYGDKIRAGYNVRDLASGYIYAMANELEIDAQSISLDDKYIRGALTGVDEKGNAKPQGLFEFQQTIRKDPRWMDTTKAQNNIASTASSVMRMFGLVG